jgi:hypothetical protein
MLFTRLRSSRCGSNAPLFDKTVYEHATIALPSREGDRFWPGGGNQKETAHNRQVSQRGGERLRDAMPRMVQKRCPSSVAEPVRQTGSAFRTGHARQAAPSRRLQAGPRRWPPAPLEPRSGMRQPFNAWQATSAPAFRDPISPAPPQLRRFPAKIQVGACPGVLTDARHRRAG